jgi:hypothetical protein
MPERYSHERVTSLFGELNALEREMVETQQALLEKIDDLDAVSHLGELKEQADQLETAIERIVEMIRGQVQSTTAVAVFDKPKLEPPSPQRR